MLELLAGSLTSTVLGIERGSGYLVTIYVLYSFSLLVCCLSYTVASFEPHQMVINVVTKAGLDTVGSLHVATRLPSLAMLWTWRFVQVSAIIWSLGLFYYEDRSFSSWSDFHCSFGPMTAWWGPFLQPLLLSHTAPNSVALHPCFSSHFWS